MKWLSIKTHVPPINTKVIIRMIGTDCTNESESHHIMEEILIGKIDYLVEEDIEDPIYWDIYLDDDHHLSNKSCLVTHFAIIDAVEWE